MNGCCVAGSSHWIFKTDEIIKRPRIIPCSIAALKLSCESIYEFRGALAMVAFIDLPIHTFWKQFQLVLLCHNVSWNCLAGGWHSEGLWLPHHVERPPRLLHTNFHKLLGMNKKWFWRFKIKTNFNGEMTRFCI